MGFEQCLLTSDEADICAPQLDQMGRRLVYARAGIAEAEIATVEVMVATSGQRKVGKGALHNVIVNNQSAKNANSRLVESRTCEHIFALELELDPEVLGYYTQVKCPRVSRLTSSGRAHISNPTLDFLVFRSNRVELVECKQLSWLLTESERSPDWHRADGQWVCEPYARFALKCGLISKIWTPPEPPGIYLRNLEACYAVRDDVLTDVELKIQQRAVAELRHASLSFKALIRAVPGFNVRSALRMIASHTAFAAIKSTPLNEIDLVTLHASAELADQEDSDKLLRFATAVMQPCAQDLLLNASAVDISHAAARLLRLEQIRSGQMPRTRRMDELQARVDDSVRDGLTPMEACLTQFSNSGNRASRVLPAHESIAAEVVQKLWQSGRISRPIDLFYAFRTECIARNIDPCGRAILDRIRLALDPGKHALATGGMRAYQAQRSASDPTARSLAAMGFGQTVHIDSSKFDNRIAPDIVNNLPSACATFYVAIDEASGLPLAHAFIFGAARTDGVALLMRDLVKRNGFLMRELHTDRGSENRSDWLDGFCAGRITQRYSPTGGSAWNGIAENMIKQINDQVAHRFRGTTEPDKAGRKVDGRFKSVKNALTAFEAIIEQVELFIYGDLAKSPGPDNVTPLEKRDSLVQSIGHMGIPVEIDEAFLIATSVPIKLKKRLDHRRGVRTELGYYTSDDLLRALRVDEPHEARADCNYPEIVYVKFRRGAWVKTFHSSILYGANRSDVSRLFDLLVAPTSRSAARATKLEIGQDRHARITSAKRVRADGSAPPMEEASAAPAEKVASEQIQDSGGVAVSDTRIESWRNLVSYEIGHSS